MSKLILLSIIIAMITIPTRAAREPNPRKSLRKVLVHMLLFQAFYTFAMMYLWGVL